MLGKVAGRLGAGVADELLGLEGLGLVGGLDELALEAGADGVALGAAAGLPQPASPAPKTPSSTVAATDRRRTILIEVSDLDTTTLPPFSGVARARLEPLSSLTNQHAAAFPVSPEGTPIAVVR